MSVLNRPYAYSKMLSEDPEETEHRRAQFLIYKVLQKADRMRSRRSWLRVRVFKLKIKIGRKLRKGFCSATLILAKPDFCRQIACRVLKSCKNLIQPKQVSSVVRTVPTAVFKVSLS
ncbi:hypothetical protein Salat_2083700 [Sesamum alatum]|uniref:Uncharacterized protein n=1 Tax=Sesamum alatum TaxID=300844 RepID=A0AAE1Y144_9LAMI|nr:hypothetical protein Salat_2083700 [Sesamum alatum]